jgi:hypothetical protein
MRRLNETVNRILADPESRKKLIAMGVEPAGGPEHAMRHARFFRDYGLDLCKVVDDFRYPMPPGMETLRGR